MITCVVLGTGEELVNVEDVQETVSNTGEYIQRALAINIVKDANGNLPAISDLEAMFRAEGALKPLRIYAKDVVDHAEDGTPIYGEEYLILETDQYTNIRHIYKHLAGPRISVNLSIDPIDISGEKAQQLEEENAELRQAIAELSMIVAPPTV